MSNHEKPSLEITRNLWKKEKSSYKANTRVSWRKERGERRERKKEKSRESEERRLEEEKTKATAAQ